MSVVLEMGFQGKHLSDNERYFVSIRFYRAHRQMNKSLRHLRQYRNDAVDIGDSL